MSKIWCFGDSFTTGEGCRLGEYYYGKYKKDEDKIWSDWLLEWYKVDVVNRGRSGASNDMIIDSLIDDFKNIKENDCVIIGKTQSSRFDVPYTNKNGKKVLVPIFPNWIDNKYKKHKGSKVIESYDKNQLETILNFQYYFSADDLYSNRHDKRFDFIIDILKEKNVNVFFWEWYKIYTEHETIDEATNSTILDGHWSFKGNKTFATYLVTKFFNNLNGYSINGIDFKNIKTLL